MSDPASIQITNGEALSVLRTVPDETYDCIVTSPPYYFVRDYGHADQVGLEASRAAFIDALAAIFSEARRTLKKTGSLWLNIQDNYCTRRAIRDDGKRSVVKGKQVESWAESAARNRVIRGDVQFRKEGIREKSLFNVPHLLAERMMQDGWVYRAEFTWLKTLTVPERARDAPSCCTECVFLFTKQPTGYVYNAHVLEERGAAGTGRPHRDLWRIGPSQFKSNHVATMPEELASRCILTGSNPGGMVLDPFAGAGTTGAMARLFGRHAHLIELNQSYIDIARLRIDGITPTFGHVLDYVTRGDNDNRTAGAFVLDAEVQGLVQSLHRYNATASVPILDDTVNGRLASILARQGGG